MAVTPTFRQQEPKSVAMQKLGAINPRRSRATGRAEGLALADGEHAEHKQSAGNPADDQRVADGEERCTHAAISGEGDRTLLRTGSRWDQRLRRGARRCPAVLYAGDADSQHRESHSVDGV